MVTGTDKKENTMKEQYQAPVDRVVEVAQRLGRFLFTAPEVHPYMSEHYRGASEMLDQQLYDQGRLEIWHAYRS